VILSHAFLVYHRGASWRLPSFALYEKFFHQGQTPDSSLNNGTGKILIKDSCTVVNINKNIQTADLKA
jgi:hypothetical protein